MKAVENSGTVIGLRGKDGVVLAAEKLVMSKLHEAGTNKRIFNIDKHVGMVNFTFSVDFFIDVSR
jgi:20S proteasome subunit alpha 7